MSVTVMIGFVTWTRVVVGMSLSANIAETSATFGFTEGGGGGER